jgi:hypothetical protein
MAPYCVGLTPDERLHTLKFRKGGEGIVGKLAALVRSQSVTLPGISAEAMQADLNLAQALGPVRDQLADLHQLVDDTILEARSECWYSATAFYTALSRLMGAAPEIKTVIAEIATFFSTGRRSKPTPQQ